MEMGPMCVYWPPTEDTMTFPSKSCGRRLGCLCAEVLWDLSESGGHGKVSLQPHLFQGSSNKGSGRSPTRHKPQEHVCIWGIHRKCWQLNLGSVNSCCEAPSFTFSAIFLEISFKEGKSLKENLDICLELRVYKPLANWLFHLILPYKSSSPAWGLTCFIW
jgi:hypothetical protein